MDVWSLLFIIIFQLLNLAKAAWNPNGALIVVDIPRHTPKMFPSEVIKHDDLGYILYFDIRFQNSQKAYAYCPLVNGIENCNYVMEPATIYHYMAGIPPPLVDRCDFPVVYSLEQNPDSSGDRCQHDMKWGTRYIFIYLLCDVSLPEQQERVPIFEMCYQDDPEKMQIIMGSFEIPKPPLLGNYLLRDERDHQFDYNSPPDHNNYFGDFYYLYQQNHHYLPRPVVPPELLPFANQRRVAHHFTNTAPMLSLLIPGWELFLRNLRDKVSRLQYKINVVAGLIDAVLDDNNREMHLGLSRDGVPIVKIPKHFWVMIHDPSYTEGIVIMMRNEPYQLDAEGQPNMYVQDTRRCSVKRCNDDANLRLAMLNPNHYPHNFIFCCNPSLINRRFRLVGGDRTRILRFP